jgi:hypothetical protein
MVEQMFPPGSCVCCREWHAELRPWKPVLWDERWFIWICERCRNLPPDELRERIEWNVEHLPILPDERLITKGRRPTQEERAECRAVAEAARAVLVAIDRWEAGDGHR